MAEDTRIEDLGPSDQEKIAALLARLEAIDAGVEALNMTLTGAIKMMTTAREALERLDCLCAEALFEGEQCIRCRALAEMGAIAREFSP